MDGTKRTPKVLFLLLSYPQIVDNKSVDNSTIANSEQPLLNLSNGLNPRHYALLNLSNAI